MERIHTLIDKLYQQKQQAASPAYLLFTVQLLHQELLQVQKSNETLGTKKVAVTLPGYISFADEMINAPFTETAKVEEPTEEKEFYTLDMVIEEEVQEVIAEPSAPIMEYKDYTLPKPPVQEILFAEPKPLVKEEPRPVYTPQQFYNSAFETEVEIPTLAQYQNRVEVHEAIAEKKESLNDRLKQEKTEVAHLLKETPIKDLRKGIGINDRFAFVKELFRNDEAMYERSIKTINNFNIYSEAEYWIARELKHKLGWDDRNETVKSFYQLVRRRFS